MNVCYWADICMDCAEDTDETLNTKHKEKQEDTQVLQFKPAWKPSVLSTIGKEIHFFAGHEIKIWESLDSFGSIIWPAALALCHFLESNRQTIDLPDKAVLEIGAGTGLVSIVASFLGAWVTATDLPEVLGNLRCNLSRNTRGCCRYTPQAAGLSWGHELDKTFPQSVYRYDYVLAADVVYHHDFLAELLITMRHFCQLGTTLIWANKIRFESDLVFTENFKRTFNTTLLEDTGDIKIYSATMKEKNGEVTSEVSEKVLKQEKEVEMLEMIKGVEENHESKTSGDMKPESKTVNEDIQQEKFLTDQRFIEETQDHEEQDVRGKEELQEDVEAEQSDVKEQETMRHLKSIKDEKDCESEESEDEDAERFSESDSTEETSTEHKCETDRQQDYHRTWAPTLYYIPGKEIHYFLGQQIKIQESVDSFGATLWPAALALCRFLETAEGQRQINLFDRSVLELGAGTGLLSVVATLLGAKLTATDLPEILSNLTCNINRNTRGRRRHKPLVTKLFWGHRLEETFPKSTHHYDYVLATDVVYHHDFLSELLVTMCHFCQPGTILVWANKIRYATDLSFVENFHKCFNSTLLAELDEVRIYVATCRTPEDVGEEKDIEQSDKQDVLKVIQDQCRRNDEGCKDLESRTYDSEEQSENNVKEHNEEEETLKTERSHVEHEQQHEQTQSSESDSEENQEHEELQDCETSQEDEEVENSELGDTRTCQRFWAPTVYYKPDKEIYCFLGYEISIQESIDSYGAVIWPAALALCRFLEMPTGQQQINLLDKSTLELGAGTGLVSVVATLLGAKLTATDLPEILGNLRCNLDRNTRWYRKHEPQVVALAWGHKLEEMFPRSTHRYDYVLAADVVYHHDFLSELLVTMRHFCQRGTTLIWANKVRYQTDLLFVENFQKTFNTTLLTELDEVRIYSATTRRSDDEHETRPGKTNCK